MTRAMLPRSQERLRSVVQISCGVRAWQGAARMHRKDCPAPMRKGLRSGAPDAAAAQLHPSRDLPRKAVSCPPKAPSHVCSLRMLMMAVRSGREREPWKPPGAVRHPDSPTRRNLATDFAGAAAGGRGLHSAAGSSDAGLPPVQRPGTLSGGVCAPGSSAWDTALQASFACIHCVSHGP